MMHLKDLQTLAWSLARGADRRDDARYFAHRVARAVPLVEEVTHAAASRSPRWPLMLAS